MFINPNIAINEKWIIFPEWMTDEFKQKCIQPNAIDFTIDELYNIQRDNPFVLNEQQKQMRGVVSYKTDENGFWNLEKSSYDFKSDFYVRVPENVAAYLIVRSTLNRNGLWITAGLYDSGFQGHIAGVLHNMLGQTKIAPRTRIGQIIFVNSESSSLYAGGYNHPIGTHYTNV